MSILVLKEAVAESKHVEYPLESAPSALEEATDPGNDAEILSRWPVKTQKRIVHKIDIRLIPVCGLLFCISLLDRTNLSYAAIAGLNKDLKIRNIDGADRYSVIVLIYFVTYTIFQAPATILCRKIGPRVFLSSITLLWGGVIIAFGFAQNWKDLVGLRTILGLLEAGFGPGIVYLMSTWYTRYEIGKRYAMFFLISCVAAAFGGILAYGLTQMEGVGGLHAWRWIFIMEGILTCVISSLGFKFLLSFPDNTSSRSLRFLAPEELRCIIARINVDRGDVEIAKFDLKNWAASGKDWKIWAYASIFGCITLVSYALANFLPIILHGELGYDVGTSQCLVSPPYVFAGIVMFISGWWSDRYHMRAPALVFNALLTLIGLVIAGFHHDPKVRYVGIFLTTAGSNANVPISLAYQANNIRGQWKRNFASSSFIGFGGIGGIIGSTVFRSQDAPTYLPGISVAIGSQVVLCLVVVALTIDFRRQNDKADRGEKALEEGDAEFRYTY